MSILIKGVNMPDSYYIYGYYICGDGRVFDPYRRNVVGEALQYDQPEIVRCKDCMFWNTGSCNCEDITVRGLEYYVGDICTEENDFCSYAKRRADGA